MISMLFIYFFDGLLDGLLWSNTDLGGYYF